VVKFSRDKHKSQLRTLLGVSYSPPVKAGGNSSPAGSIGCGGNPSSRHFAKGPDHLIAAIVKQLHTASSWAIKRSGFFFFLKEK